MNRQKIYFAGIKNTYFFTNIYILVKNIQIKFYYAIKNKINS